MDPACRRRRGGEGHRDEGRHRRLRRGTEFSKAILADWGHRDVEDFLAAVDDVIARGLADADRLGVGGWSYGGMATNYLVATTTRFKAATSGASISNILAGYGTDHYVRDYEQCSRRCAASACQRSS